VVGLSGPFSHSGITSVSETVLPSKQIGGGGVSNWVRPLTENCSSLKVTGHRKEFEPYRGPGGRDGGIQAKIVVEADKA